MEVAMWKQFGKLLATGADQPDDRSFIVLLASGLALIFALTLVAFETLIAV